MEFCPKCGSVLIQKGKNNKCPRCRYYTKNKIKIRTTEKIEGIKEKLAVLKKEETNILPKVSAICKKCGHNQAYFWTVQMRAADEAEVRFFKCAKCDYTWKEYR